MVTFENEGVWQGKGNGMIGVMKCGTNLLLLINLVGPINMLKKLHKCNKISYLGNDRDDKNKKT